MKKYHVCPGKHAHFVKGNSVHMNLVFRGKKKKKSVILSSTGSSDCSQLWLRMTQSLSIKQNATLLIKFIIRCPNMNFLLFTNILQSLRARFACIITLVQPEMTKCLTSTFFFFSREVINFLKPTLIQVGW